MITDSDVNYVEAKQALVKLVQSLRPNVAERFKREILIIEAWQKKAAEYVKNVDDKLFELATDVIGLQAEAAGLLEPDCILSMEDIGSAVRKGDFIPYVPPGFQGGA